MSPDQPNVARFSAYQADREHREHEILKDGLAAATDALYERTGHDRDVRIALVAMYGDPFGPEHGQSVPIEAEFICLDGSTPLTDAQRRYLAFETMRAASSEMYDEMKLGLGISDLIEDLSEAAEGGDEAAAADLRLITEALNRHAAVEPPSGGEAGPDTGAKPSE